MIAGRIGLRVEAVQLVASHHVRLVSPILLHIMYIMCGYLYLCARMTAIHFCRRLRFATAATPPLCSS